VTTLSYRFLRLLAAPAALIVFLAVLATVDGTASARATHGLSNGGFESGRVGWVAAPARRARISVTRYGHSGHGLLVRRTSGRPVRVTSAHPISVAGARGDRYRASGWVRASRNGETASVTVREYRGTRVVRTSRRTLALRAGAWTPLGTSLTRRGSRTTFRVTFGLGRGRASDRLTLDQVRLQRTVSQATSGASACVTQRGVPRCGAILGEAYGSNSDPAPFESTINHKIGIHRTYWTATGVNSAVTVASNDIANGRIPWISFKLPYAWDQMAAGAGDAWAKDLATKLAALPGPVWVAFHHEPEGDGDITQWTAMQAHLAPLVRATAPNVAYTIILTGWDQLYGPSAYHLDSLWPKNTKIDIAGFDPYNFLGVVKNGSLVTTNTDMTSTYFKPISAWAKNHGIAWGLAETGYTDYASKYHPHWIQQTFASLQAYGGVALTYFNTPLNNFGSWPLETSTKVADYAAAQAQSHMLR
jgi:hypothetical protein